MTRLNWPTGSSEDESYDSPLADTFPNLNLLLLWDLERAIEKSEGEETDETRLLYSLCKCLNMKDIQWAKLLLKEFLEANWEYSLGNILKELPEIRRSLVDLYKLELVFQPVIPVSQRTKDALKEALAKHGLTHAPAIDSMVTYESVDLEEIKQHNQLIEDTTIRRIKEAIKVSQ